MMLKQVIATLGTATLLAGMVPAPLAAQNTVQYLIEPGSSYTFKPSGFVPIPGGQPFPFQLDFGVAGRLAVEFGPASDMARITAAHLRLSGNEVIQSDPPDMFSQVTADRVEQFLLDQEFELSGLIIGGLEFASVDHSRLLLTDFDDGTLALVGGFDHTFVDGTAMLFSITATPIPEPSGLMIAMAASACFTAYGFARERRRLWVRRARL